MIEQLISNYGEIGALGTLVLAMVWYLINQTKRQGKREESQDAERKEQSMFFRDMITGELKGLHNDSLKNADLNNQTIILQKDLEKDLRDHNGHSKKAWNKAIDSLSTICERLDGGDPKMKRELEWYKSRGIVDRRSTDEKVSVERRK